jgi:hypothetical protein
MGRSLSADSQIKSGFVKVRGREVVDPVERTNHGYRFLALAA